MLATIASSASLFNFMSQADEAVLSTNDPQLSLNKKHAIIVRLGEKKILNATLETLQNLLQKRSRLKRKR
jgi:hypothetical protein